MWATSQCQSELESPLLAHREFTDALVHFLRSQETQRGQCHSGGASGDDDFAQAVKTAVINKRAGGTGLISGRKAFQRPMKEGIQLLNAIQNVYLDDSITIA